MTKLLNAIAASDHLTPIVIASRRSAQSPLTKKVIDGILEADILMPILTRNSINSQWVNQEIGYTRSLEQKSIIPIVEEQTMDDLKGFIHKQLDLPYSFRSFEDNPRKESFSFNKTIKQVIQDLTGEAMDDVDQINKTEPKKLKKEISIKLPNKDSIIHENKDIHLANSKFNSSLTGQFLNQENGLISIWANVTDIHNQMNSSLKHLYILGYATNKGNRLNNPMMAVYPNAWHISRVAPTSQSPSGSWRFACNNIEKTRTEILSNKILDGWHMFTVIWSKEKNYIMFLIDEEIIKKVEFDNWPTNFSGSMTIGTWPNRAPIHAFNSQVGQLLIINKDYDKKYINGLLQNKPK